MDELDDFMKQKLGDHNPFPFREDYWEQAAALLDADRRRRNRRKGRLLLLLLLLLLVGWCTFVPKQKGLHGTTGPSEQENHRADPKSKPFATNGDSVEIAIPFGQATEELKKTSSEPTAENNAGIRAENTQPFLRKNGGSGGRSSTKEIWKADDVDSTRAQLKITSPTIANKILESGAAPLNSPSPATPPVWAAAPLPPAADHANKSVTEAAILKVVLPPAMLLPGLPLRMLEYNHAPESMPPAQPAQGTPPFLPKPVRQWHWGIGVYSSFYTGGAPGAAAQVFVQRNLSKGWRLETGVLYRYRPYASTLWEGTDSTAPQQSVQLRYGFGFESTTYTLTPTAQHWLEIPMGVQWKYRSLSVGGGISPGFLLMVTGTMATLREVPRDEIIESSEENVRLEKGGFIRFYAAPWLGLNWQAGRRLTVCARGHWQPQPLNGNNTTLWIDAGLRYHFK